MRIFPTLVGNHRNALGFVGNILQNVSMALFGTGLVLHLSESSPKGSVGSSLAGEGCGGMCLEKGMGMSFWSQRDAQGSDSHSLIPSLQP